MFEHRLILTKLLLLFFAKKVENTLKPENLAFKAGTFNPYKKSNKYEVKIIILYNFYRVILYESYVILHL